MKTNRRLAVKLILLILLFLVISIVAFNYFGLYSSDKMEVAQGKEKVFSNVEKVMVDTISLPIKIYESDVKQVTIKDQSKVHGFITNKPTKIYQEGGVVYVKQSKVSSFLSSVRGNIVIEIPRKNTLEYDVNTISGNIDYDVTSRDMLRITSISGEIKVVKGGEKAVLKSTSGSVKVHSTFEEISAKSVSGNVYVVANQDSKQVKTSSVSGSIQIQLENVLGYTMEYSTTSGSVVDTYENIDYLKSGYATRGDESLKIDASNVSGSIKLVDWNN